MEEPHELVEQDLPPAVEPERRHRGLHPASVTVRVRAPDVELPVEPTLDQRLAVVRDVDSEVRRHPGAPDEHALDVLAELFRLQPDRPVPLFQRAGRA